jgi:hypothetical protein
LRPIPLLLLWLPAAVALAANPNPPSLNARVTKARSAHYPALVQPSSTGAAKVARQSLLKQRTGALGTTVRHGGVTVTSNTRPPAKTIVVRPLSPK